ncbi:hypothetical protein CQW23_09421 [Capsicum baccatum]|uniref:Uncharacterized protein n=1 Tax=Capsicum baccatum TaxID=33114 RepID=A0A2G2WWQ6_CAPBA|nr:hypothetical protein CQW23_09421 [Capsicum baccatum]
MRRVDGCDAILDTSRHDRIEPQLFWLWQPAQMVTNAIGDAAHQDLEIGDPVASSIWNCCQVAQPMTILSGAECVDPKDGFRDSSCSSMNHPKGSLIEDIKDATLSLETSPTASPQPLLPLLAPSPLAPFTNSTSPKLSVSSCLLPSLPPDAILDKILGIGFVCDLNDNIPAPWPSMSHSTASSCKKSVRIPALPVVASGQISENIYLLI